jgi:hypothetical protein
VWTDLIRIVDHAKLANAANEALILSRRRAMRLNATHPASQVPLAVKDLRLAMALAAAASIVHDRLATMMGRDWSDLDCYAGLPDHTAAAWSAT